MEKFQETDLFYPLYRYYTANNYVVNTEVENKYGSKRADIILTRTIKDDIQEVVGIELKRTLSMELLDQGDYWKKYTDYNYICVPTIKQERPKVVKKIIDSLGFGLIEIDLTRYNRFYKNIDDKNFVFLDDNGKVDQWKLGITLTVPPKLNNPTNRNKKALQSVIYDEHQHWSVAGQQAKKTYVSGYKLLMHDVYSFLREQQNNSTTDGWVTLDEIVKHIEDHSSNVVKNHYKNTRNGIRQALIKFEDGDIETLKTGNVTVYRIIDGSTKYLNMEKR